MEGEPLGLVEDAGAREGAKSRSAISSRTASASASREMAAARTTITRTFPRGTQIFEGAAAPQGGLVGGGKSRLRISAQGDKWSFGLPWHPGLVACGCDDGLSKMA